MNTNPHAARAADEMRDACLLFGNETWITKQVTALVTAAIEAAAAENADKKRFDWLENTHFCLFRLDNRLVALGTATGEHAHAFTVRDALDGAMQSPTPATPAGGLPVKEGS